MLKEAMEHRGWRFRELSDGLASLGVVMAPAAVNRRVNRGNFSAGFLLMCLEALQAEVDIQWREWSDTPSTPKTLPRTSGRKKKPVEALEDIVGGWSANRAVK